MTNEELSILQDIVDIYEEEDMYPLLLLKDKQVHILKKAIKELEQQKEQEVYVIKGMLSDDELKHIGEQMKKVSLQLISAKQEPCADCISRETLLKYLETIVKDTNPDHYESKDKWYHNNGFNLCKVQIKKFVENLAPVAPQSRAGREEPSRNGYWIRVDKGKFKCSECDIVHFIAQYPIGKIDWCPNCGAKMQKRIEECR